MQSWLTGPSRSYSVSMYRQFSWSNLLSAVRRSRASWPTAIDMAPDRHGRGGDEEVEPYPRSV